MSNTNGTTNPVNSSSILAQLIFTSLGRQTGQYAAMLDGQPVGTLIRVSDGWQHSGSPAAFSKVKSAKEDFASYLAQGGERLSEDEAAKLPLLFYRTNTETEAVVEETDEPTGEVTASDEPGEPSPTPQPEVIMEFRIIRPAKNKDELDALVALIQSNDEAVEVIEAKRDSVAREARIHVRSTRTEAELLQVAPEPAVSE